MSDVAQLTFKYMKAVCKFDLTRDGPADYGQCVAGAALIWLTERGACPVQEVHNGLAGPYFVTWGVVWRKGDRAAVLSGGHESPLEAMLYAIEHWEDR